MPRKRRALRYQLSAQAPVEVLARPPCVMAKRASSGVDAVVVEMVHCVRVGARARPLPNPLIKECGATCVPINSTDPWLNKVVGDRTRADASYLIKEFIDGVLGELSSKHTESTPTTERSLGGESTQGKEGSLGPEAVRPAGRRGLRFDSDSDNEALEAIPMSEDKSAAARRRRRGEPRAELQTVVYRGLELIVKARDHGRGLAVPLEGETLTTILKHLRAQVVAGGSSEVQAAARAKAARRQEVMDARGDEDAGRIRWMFADCSYKIFYNDEEGKPHQCCKGLKVPRHDPFGQTLSHEAFQTARLVALSKARALWNACDKSSAARYDDSHHGSSHAT